jgi:serine/threonine protein kinase
MSTDDGYDYEFIGHDWKGKLLNHNYMMLQPLGFGGYSCVWLCYGIDQKKCFAIKMSNPDDIKHASNENIIMKSLTGNNFVKIYDSFIHEEDDTNDKHMCLIIDYMSMSAYDLMKQYRKKSLKCPDDIVYKIIKETAIAINDINSQNLIHADIKPENILIKFKTPISLNDKLVKFVNEQDVTSMMHKMKIEMMKNKKANKDTSRKIVVEKLVEKLFTEFITTVAIFEDFGENNSDHPSEDSSERESDIESNQESEEESDREYDYVNKIKHDELFDNNSDEESSEGSEGENDPSYNVEKITVDDIECVKLCDFGSCIKMDEVLKKDIQTIYYKAPEVLLNIGYNNKCDIWSLGCTMYELLMCEILFDPEKSQQMSRNRHHIYDITETIGEVPETMINASPVKNIFWKNSNKLKTECKSHVCDCSCSSDEPNFYIKKKFKWNEIILKHKLLYKMLQCDPLLRISANEILLSIANVE